MKKQSNVKRNASYGVYTKLKADICSLVIRPGDSLTESKIAEMLGVSRTPVREALSKLEQEGLVQLIPDKGAFVTEIDPKSINEIFIARQALEGIAAKLAAQRICDAEIAALEAKFREAELAWTSSGWGGGVEEIHSEIIRISGVTLIGKLLSSFSGQVERFRNIGNKEDEFFAKRESEVFSEHKRIFEAIKKRDGDLAEKCMREHLHNSKNALIQLWFRYYLVDTFSFPT